VGCTKPGVGLAEGERGLTRVGRKCVCKSVKIAKKRERNPGFCSLSYDVKQQRDTREPLSDKGREYRTKRRQKERWQNNSFKGMKALERQC